MALEVFLEVLAVVVADRDSVVSVVIDDDAHAVYLAGHGHVHYITAVYLQELSRQPFEYLSHGDVRHQRTPSPADYLNVFVHALDEEYVIHADVDITVSTLT